MNIIDDNIKFNPFSEEYTPLKKVIVEDRFNLDEVTDFLLNMTNGKELIEEFKNTITNKCNDIELNKLFSEYEKQVLFGFKKYFENLIVTIENSEGEDELHDLQIEKAFENERKREFMEMCGGEDWDYNGL
ncbi:hypothetical protein [Clostridium sp.]|uniref:hypothetical protein n=1 Tax=Clostridium sp. TaxID=1506 RepID=UPI003216A059